MTDGADKINDRIGTNFVTGIAALKATNYKIYGAAEAAEMLGFKPTTLASRIKALGIPVRRTE